VQRLLRDRSAWELAYGYDEMAGAEMAGASVAAISAHA
jgi:hypothetical protein